MLHFLDEFLVYSLFFSVFFVFLSLDFPLFSELLSTFSNFELTFYGSLLVSMLSYWTLSLLLMAIDLSEVRALDQISQPDIILQEFQNSKQESDLGRVPDVRQASLDESDLDLCSICLGILVSIWS